MELQVQVTVDSELELSSWNLSSSQSHTKLDPAAGPGRPTLVSRYYGSSSQVHAQSLARYRTLMIDAGQPA